MDIKSPSDAHVIASLYRHLGSYQFRITVRDRAEAIALARDYGLPYVAVGRDDPGRGRKILNYAIRIAQVSRAAKGWDASVSFNNMNAILLSRLKRKTSITLMDNDLEFAAGAWSLAKRLEMRNNLSASRIIVPDVFPIETMVKLGARRERIQTFDGFKEDLYTADFRPDPTFAATIPFESYVVLRPEALSAVYVRESRSIVPELLHRLSEQGLNIVYLPRVPADRAHLPPDAKNVHVPSTPPNGLQLAWHSSCVLTGSGSLAREAACLGVPSVSFFPGPLLAVDRKMVQEKRVFHSRDPAEIVEHVLRSRVKKERSVARSLTVRNHVLGQIRAAVPQDA